MCCGTHVWWEAWCLFSVHIIWTIKFDLEVAKLSFMLTANCQHFQYLKKTYIPTCTCNLRCVQYSVLNLSTNLAMKQTLLTCTVIVWLWMFGHINNCWKVKHAARIKMECHYCALIQTHLIQRSGVLMLVHDKGCWLSKLLKLLNLWQLNSVITLMSFYNHRM